MSICLRWGGERHTGTETDKGILAMSFLSAIIRLSYEPSTPQNYGQSKLFFFFDSMQLLKFYYEMSNVLTQL